MVRLRGKLTMKMRILYRKWKRGILESNLAILAT